MDCGQSHIKFSIGWANYKVLISWRWLWRTAKLFKTFEKIKLVFSKALKRIVKWFTIGINSMVELFNDDSFFYRSSWSKHFGEKTYLQDTLYIPKCYFSVYAFTSCPNDHPYATAGGTKCCKEKIQNGFLKYDCPAPINCQEYYGCRDKAGNKTELIVSTSKISLLSK